MRLYEAKQAHALLAELWPKIKAALAAGHVLILTIERERKTRIQEEKYHAIIGEIAAVATHAGCKLDAESFKRLLLDKFARDTGRTPGRLLPNLDGTGVVDVGIQSRRFTVADASEFIEWLHAWCGDNGVELSQ